MKVLLTEEMIGLGAIGDIVNVKGGYARNYLIPTGIALETSSKNAKAIKHQVTQLEAKKKVAKKEATEFKAKIEAVVIKLELRLGEGGKAFGSISSKDIADALALGGLKVDRRRINLVNTIKTLGEHIVSIKVHSEVDANLRVFVSKMAEEEEVVHI